MSPYWHHVLGYAFIGVAVGNGSIARGACFMVGVILLGWI